MHLSSAYCINGNIITQYHSEIIAVYHLEHVSVILIRQHLAFGLLALQRRNLGFANRHPLLSLLSCLLLWPLLCLLLWLLLWLLLLVLFACLWPMLCYYWFGFVLEGVGDINFFNM